MIRLENNSMTQEMTRLDKVAQDSWDGRSIDTSTIRYSYKIFRRFCNEGSILELGPAIGKMTELIVKDFNEIDVVEGSEYFCDVLRSKFPNINVIKSLFENFVPDRKYDFIILGHVLEHVENPSTILNLVSDWLTDNGKIFCAVPNSRSLHRQAGVIMNLLSFEEELNETDNKHGHRRVYNPETFRRDFINAGYRIEHFGGYWIKTQSNKQIEQSWDEEAIEAFMVLGERYPDIAAELYIIASKLK
jgi:2-polyprenyl-3-methyl-5-hydroxy-6-metoxy-1,4-benzoquinol methylase